MRLRQSVDYRGQNKTGSTGPGGRRRLSMMTRRRRDLNGADQRYKIR